MTTNSPAERSKAKAATAPDADDARNPDRPTDIAKPTWTYITKRTFREFGKDQCPDAAAGLTYYAVLSLPIEELTTSTSAGFALVLGLIAALWSASGYVGAFSRAMNRVYEVDEGRGFIKLRATMLGVTVFAVMLVALIAGMLVLSGPVADAAGRAVNLGGDLLTVWSIAKWPVVVLLVVLIIAVLYYVTPNVKQPRFRWMSIGSFIALLAFILASLGFGFYVANFSNYNKTYGAIGGVIVMLLWLWILNMSLLFGAEFDAEMERGRELQAGIDAEETIQLPPRGTKRSEKLEKHEEEDEIVDGERLSVQHTRVRTDPSRDRAKTQSHDISPGAG